MIDYRVEIADAHAHLYRVTLRVPAPAALQRLSLPVWAPGSYMVRDFARHLSALSATQGGRPVALTQLDKTSWQAACSGRAVLQVSALVYAFDRSVRGAFLDAQRGFFNASSLCLRAEGREGEPHRITLARLPRGWQAATAMPAAGRQRWQAADYEELIDHPFELGRFWRGSFTAGGVEHQFVVSGAWPTFDGPRLLADTQRLCEAHVAFWHGRHAGQPRRSRPPFDRYLFLLNAVDDAQGGLEHRASTALVAARRDLPRQGMGEAGDGWVGLLGLISHEYFHAWNVKRLKPRDLVRPDLGRENATTLLWFFEGVTSYYDELMLLRAGLIDAARYLELLARPLNALAANPGRFVQSVAEASFDAWTKYYKADENTPNATVNYYTKGALVALLFDLALRERGGSLDDVMRLLWRRSSGGGPIGEDDIADALQAVAGTSLQTQLDAWVHGRSELPLAAALGRAGVRVDEDAPTLAALLGLRLSEGPVSGVQVRSVQRGSAAERAGVAAGDELLAADGWRLRRLEDQRGWCSPGRPFELLLARDQKVLTLRVEPPQAAVSAAFRLGLDASAAAAALALRRAWLAGPAG
jgi:predicted metalloprotease with PDZ domain